MRIGILTVIGLAVLLAVPAMAQDEKPASAVKAAESVEFMKQLATRMGSKDATVRFAVREALVVMGKRAIAALNARMAEEKDEHVKAFIARTILRLKSIKTTPQGRSYAASRGRDLDRLAMQCGLTLEQIAQIQPLLAKHDKNVKELWAEFREAGAWRDKGAYKDLQEEMKLLAEESEPVLRRYLNEDQMKLVSGQLKGNIRSRGAFGVGGGSVQILRGGATSKPKKK